MTFAKIIYQLSFLNDLIMHVCLMALHGVIYNVVSIKPNYYAEASTIILFC